ncbi:diguanylate cyclase (GGDEF) domain-containing protein [Meinhardsimonia xiamenensis]|jgi:diguanylate cyclase (GGDEF)-like protein|uniref:diguanylate cyclase n=1 Tax=Meinhardsimonia xiamenensis TaxID=990712 RepID=A0A1G9CHR7_9RHOB|nr:diguanylate cyclase (GGDEF)-like protein [Meinhardsimonia xiamenensis]SDK51233.1 diguanylate cyclase (GGDEF) domain-containing protein [Meinhardsimonia xiamenensis]
MLAAATRAPKGVARVIRRGLLRYGALLRHRGLRWLAMFVPAAIAVTVAVVVLVPEPAADQLLLRDVVRKSELWRRQILGLLLGGSTVFESGEFSRADRESLARVTHASDIFLLRLFDAGGRLIWSSRGGGEGVMDESLPPDVLRGETVASLRPLHEGEVDNLWLHAANPGDREELRWVATVYRTVERDGRLVGAMEFHSDITDTRRPVVRLLRSVIGGLGSLGLAVTIVGLIMTTRASRRRLNELRERAERDAQIMAEQVKLAREVQLLSDLNEWLQSASTLDELFGMISRFMGHIMPLSEGAIYVYSNSRDVLDGGVGWNGMEVEDHIRPDSCWALRRGRTFVHGTTEVSFSCAHVEPHDGRPYFCFPILAHGETVGLMHLRAAPEETAAEFRESRKLAQICAEQISMAIANVRLRDQLQEQSVRDPLTGLYNRRHMMDRLRALTERARNGGEPVALLAIDVDHFKKFNDNHGHDAGDMVLRAVATVLDQSVSGEEIACRPGGEEFALVLPGVGGEAALARAEALRAAVEAIEVRYGDRMLPRITISVGVAEFPRDAAMVQELILASDRALYAAKAQGRNRVVACAGAGVTATRGGAGVGAAPGVAGADGSRNAAERLARLPRMRAGGGSAQSAGERDVPG